MIQELNNNSQFLTNRIEAKNYNWQALLQDKFFPKNNTVSVRVSKNESPKEIHKRFLLEATSEAGLDGTEQQRKFVERYVNSPLEFKFSKDDPSPKDSKKIKLGELERGTQSYVLNANQVKYLKALQNEFIAQGGKLRRGKEYSLPQSTNNSESFNNGQIQKINLEQLARQAEVLTSKIGIPTDPNQLKPFFVNLSNAPNLSVQDNALFSLIKSAYGGGNLKGHHFREILSLAKEAGVKVQNLRVSGNSARFDLSIADILRIKIARISVQEKANRVEKVYYDAMNNNEVSAFIRGVVKGAFNSIKGTIGLVTDLPGTMKALWQIVSNPVETFNALKNELGKTWEKFKNAPPHEKSEMLGELVGSAIIEILLGKGIGKAGSILAKTKTGTEILEKAKLAKLNTAAKFAETFSDEAANIASQRARRKLATQMYSGIPADILADMAIVAGNKVKNGAVKFSEFANQMVNEFGNRIKPHVENLYRGAMIQLGKKIDEVEIKNFDVNEINVPKTPGEYPTKIKWGILEIDARPHGEGFWGRRVPQSNSRVDAFERKINPNDESYYIKHPNGGYVQFENLNKSVLQDGKLVMQPNSSIYKVYDKPEFLRRKILDEAVRQVQAAKHNGLKVEWLVSDKEAVNQLKRFFKENGIDINVKYFPE